MSATRPGAQRRTFRQAPPRRRHIQFEEGLVTDEGEVTNAETAKFLRNYMAELRDFIVRCYMVLPRNEGTPE